MRIEVRNVNGVVRLDLQAENQKEAEGVRQFVEMVNGKPVVIENPEENTAFDKPLRIESVGYDDNGQIDSIAIEAT